MSESETLYPADALRTAHARGVESAFTGMDIQRAYMQGIVDFCTERREPAPQWMVDQLWQVSTTKTTAERRLQGR